MVIIIMHTYKKYLRSSHYSSSSDDERRQTSQTGEVSFTTLSFYIFIVWCMVNANNLVSPVTFKQNANALLVRVQIQSSVKWAFFKRNLSV